MHLSSYNINIIEHWNISTWIWSKDESFTSGKFGEQGNVCKYERDRVF
jgi:hypothetical protein